MSRRATSGMKLMRCASVSGAGGQKTHRAISGRLVKPSFVFVSVCTPATRIDYFCGQFEKCPRVPEGNKALKQIKKGETNCRAEIYAQSIVSSFASGDLAENWRHLGRKLPSQGRSESVVLPELTGLDSTRSHRPVGNRRSGGVFLLGRVKNRTRLLPDYFLTPVNSLHQHHHHQNRWHFPSSWNTTGFILLISHFLIPFFYEKKQQKYSSKNMAVGLQGKKCNLPCNLRTNLLTWCQTCSIISFKRFVSNFIITPFSKLYHRAIDICLVLV